MTKDQLETVAALLAESYNKFNHIYPKSFCNEVRHTLRSAGYVIEQLPDKTTKAVKHEQ